MKTIHNHDLACLAHVKKIILGLMAVLMGVAFAPVAMAQDMTLSSIQESKVFAGGVGYQGAYTNIQFQASLSGDFYTVPNPVTLSLSGAPAGVSYRFTTTSFTNSQSKDALWLGVTNVAKGVYPLTISGTTNGVAVGNTLTITLIVGTLWTYTNDIVNVAWSSPGNWSAGAPGVGDNVMFQNFGTTNFLDGSLTVDSLTFLPGIANVTQNLTMAPGSTLSVLGTNGFAINIDFPSATSQKTTAVLAGTDATLLVSNSVGNVAINGVNTSTGTTLDMRNLDNFIAYGNTFGVGDVALAAQGAVGQQAVKLYFANTNLVNASHIGNFALTNHDYVDYAVSFINNTHNYNNGQSFDAGLLGLQNVFQADSFGFGQGRAGGSLTDIKFNSNANNSSASFRNTDGISPVSLVAVAVDSYGPGGAGSNTKFQLNFTGGHVDMLVDQMWLGRNGFYTNTSNANQIGKLLFDNGTVNVNTMRLGYQAYTNDSYPNGTVTVGGNATNNALLVVNTELNLGYTSGDYSGGVNAAKVNGQVIINTNGTVMANQVTVGTLSGNNTITINNGGTLDVSNTVAGAGTRLGTLTVNSGGAITLHKNGANTLVYVTNLVANGGVINIASATGSGSFAPVISYNPGSGESASFVAGSVPLGYSGATVFNNTTTHTIDLTLLVGPPKHLLWQGYVNDQWDNSTFNWLDLNTGLHTNFTTGDNVVFDDTAATSSINVTEDVVPLQSSSINGMTMTNNSLAYVFSGAGGIRGAALFGKYGSGSVEMDNYSEVAVTVNQGFLTGSGTIGSATIASGTTCSWLGNVLGNVANSGSVTNSGSINGSLTLQDGSTAYNSGSINGAVTQGANTYFYNAGTLTAIGSSTVGTNSVLVNAGTIYGSTLTIAVGGTLSDVVLGSAGVSPGSINVGTLVVNGSFYPGGNGIGTTKVTDYDYSTGNQLGAPNGRVQLNAGSMTTFQFNSTNAQPYTKLLSQSQVLGPSASFKSLNGCTLVLNNVGPTPFAAGQTFKLFGQYYTDGNPGNAGLNTTNSYPTIVPATPGSGLLWDLGQIYTTGTIGVINASSVQITLTNSTSVVSATNVVTHLSWPADYVGSGWVQQQLTTLTNGLSMAKTNWSDVGLSDYVSDIYLTNNVGDSPAVFYRFVRP